MLNPFVLQKLMESSIIAELRREFPNGINNYQLKIAKIISSGVSYMTVLTIYIYAIVSINKKKKIGRIM